jgi:hypothetical protein
LIQIDYLDKFGKISKLGSAISESHFGLEEISIIYPEWIKALQEGIVLVDDLHLTYLICPLVEETQWVHLFQCVNTFDKIKHSIIEKCDINVNYIMQKAMARGYKSQNDDPVQEVKCKRLWNALLLCELGGLEISKGNEETLIQTSLMRCGMIIKFCEKMEWNYFKVLIQEWIEGE